MRCCAGACPTLTQRAPTSVLALRCEFLNGTYQASLPGSVDEPEWPPHPARLHAALIAAGWAIGGGRSFPDDAHQALRWLERQPAPAIAQPECVSARSAPEVYVPRNLTSAESRDVLNALRAGRDPSRQIGRVSRTFPTTVTGDQPVWYVWEHDDAAYRPALERLAREVQYLGSSRSPVCCDLAEDPPRQTLRPLEPGEAIPTATLRTADEGFTDQLIASRHKHPPRTIGALTSYGPAQPMGQPRAQALGGPFRELVVLAFERTFPFTILNTPLVAQAFREAVLSHAGDDAPAVLHGHGCNPHVAFLPLANVGHPNANGQIMGMAIAIPEGASEQERELILKATGAVTELRNRDLPGTWRLRPARERTLRTLSPSRWTGPARRWQSVTPVILDRHPKSRSDATMERALRATFSNAGAPEPEQMDWSEIPWQPAAVPAPAYRGMGLPDGLRLHIDVTFQTPVRGPLLVGRGRYLGVGMFSPASPDDEQ